MTQVKLLAFYAKDGSTCEVWADGDDLWIQTEDDQHLEGHALHLRRDEIDEFLTRLSDACQKGIRP